MSLATWASERASAEGLSKDAVAKAAVVLDEMIELQMKSLVEEHERAKEGLKTVWSEACLHSIKNSDVSGPEMLEKLGSGEQVFDPDTTEIHRAGQALLESAKATLAQMVSFYKLVDQQKAKLQQEKERKRTSLLLAAASTETGSKRARVEAAEKAGQQVPKKYKAGGVWRCHECEWELIGCQCKPKTK
jgi:hypothetical protein